MVFWAVGTPLTRAGEAARMGRYAHARASERFPLEEGQRSVRVELG